MTSGSKGKLGTPAPGGNLAVRVVCELVFAALAIAFVYAALVRRLNFDETLALRSGWLLVAHERAAPAFAMPWTALLGAISHAVSDPGAALTVARLVTSVSVVVALRLSLGALAHDDDGDGLSRSPSRWTDGRGALAAALTLSQVAFAVHGLEFRYEAAILLGLLVALPRLSRASEGDLALYGACTVWVALHHVKGLVFALVMLVLALARGAPRRSLGALASGALVMLAAWALFLERMGAIEQFFGVHRAFTDVGREAARVSLASALGSAVSRDAGFTALALGALIATGFALARRGVGSWRTSKDAWLGAVVLAGVLFVLVHPHPWAYMLALPAPFASVLVVRRVGDVLAVNESTRGRAAIAGLCAVVIATHAVIARSVPWSQYAEALRAPREPEVATLRVLRRLARPGDRVIDPSGVAYFVSPCTTEWYADTLFAERARRGLWMRDLAASAQPERCAWVLNTYRLGLLPTEFQARIPRGWVLVTGGLGLRRGDARLPPETEWPRLAHDRISSYW